MSELFEGWTSVDPHTTTALSIPGLNPLVTVITPGGTVIQFYGIPGTELRISSGAVPESMAVSINPGTLPTAAQIVAAPKVAPIDRKHKGAGHEH